MSVDFHSLRKELIFTHRDDITGIISMVAIERLCDNFRYKLIPTVSVDIDYQMAGYFLENRGIEGHRLARLVNATPNSAPVTFLKWPDGTDLLADGNHRYVAAAVRREKMIKAKIVPRSIWERFKVANLPKQLDGPAFERFKSGWSGIY